MASPVPPSRRRGAGQRHAVQALNWRDTGVRKCKPAVRAQASGHRILAILLTLAVAGCASSGEPPEAEDAEVWAGAAQSKLHVTNRNWLDMRIYAVRGSDRINLLSITSMRTDSIPLPGRLLAGGGFRLLADPVGAVEPYRSNTVYLRPGQTVWWRLENALEQSSLWIY